MKKLPPLGDQEMDLLKYIDTHSPSSVRDVAAFYETEKGWARTTVLTMMERLRKKGYLVRSKFEGIFKYTAKHEARDVVTNKISEFVEKTLGGSVTPLFSYFSNSKLTSEEIKMLKQIARELEKGQGN